MFSTRSGKPISPSNVLRRWVFHPAQNNRSNAAWLTFRRTYAWAHDKGVPGKGVPGTVVARLMGHTNADVTINVYTQVLDAGRWIASAVNCSRLFTKRKRVGATVYLIATPIEY